MKSILLVALPTSAALLMVSCASRPSVDREALSSFAAAPENLSSTNTSRARTLFLKNCAHCHGADASGDEGPNLHNLDWTDEQIARRIRNGKQGEMTAFAGKLSADDVRSIVGYLRTLK